MCSRVYWRMSLCALTELCTARSCYLRCLFIDVCSIVMDNFSKAFFKEHFFEYLLRLAKDRVPNVRLKLCRLFPRYVHVHVATVYTISLRSVHVRNTTLYWMNYRQLQVEKANQTTKRPESLTEFGNSCSQSSHVREGSRHVWNTGEGW